MGIINMGEIKQSHLHHHHQIFHQDSSSWFQHEDHMNNDNGKSTPSPSSSSTITSSIGEESTLSDGSDTASSSFSPNSSGALFDLSEIMTQLPIKRGLSKFYQGKSESFTSLSRVTSIDELAKKANPNTRNLKASRSIGTGLHSYRSYTLPKPVIAKKSTARGCSSFSCKRH